MPTNPPIDWPTIRAKYETGISQRTLAREYGISQAAISKRAAREQWLISPHINQVINDNVLDANDNPEPVVIADEALTDLSHHLKGRPDQAKLQLTQHKLFADSFSQYIKIKQMLPSDKPTASGIAAELLPYLDNDQLSELASLNARQEEILETARATKLEAEQGIMSIRKKAM